MIVVADASPLHYLILLDHADLLHRLYGDVIVPDAVAAELSSPPAPDAVRNWMRHAPDWIGVVAVEASRIAEISAELDDGERAAIALASDVQERMKGAMDELRVKASI